jgi:lysophospholipase L1-like esterase
MAKVSMAASRRSSILCFGDSWAYGNYHGLKHCVRKNNHDDVQVKLVNRFGSTAKQFAEQPELLPNAVAQSNAEYVLLSLGGNDLKNFYFRGNFLMPWTATNRIEGSLTSILDELYRQHPSTKVVMYGYDFLGRADDYIFTPETSNFKRKLYRWVAIPLSNYVCSYLSNTLHSLEAKYRKQGFSFTYVPLWGTLQQVLNDEAAADRGKGYSYWKHSASEYMHDPIHANELGYRVLMGRLYNEYFAKELGSELAEEHHSATIDNAGSFDAFRSGRAEQVATDVFSRTSVDISVASQALHRVT